MAIGVARTMGFKLPINFNFPYLSLSIDEFWRRWHISLSSWIKDYVYIPLGGSKINNLKTYLNLLISMLLCGLWHGAAWKFIIWGGFHGYFSDPDGHYWEVAYFDQFKYDDHGNLQL